MKFLSILLCVSLAACSQAMAEPEVQWLQLAKGKQANYELDFDGIAIEPDTNSRVVRMRVTPLSDYIREDKIQVKFIHEYGIVLCNENGTSWLVRTIST